MLEKLKAEIEELREKLNNMFLDKNADRSHIQEVSEALDVLIVEYMRIKLQKQEKKEYKAIMDEIEIILKKLDLLGKEYQLYRIVDPVNNRVIALCTENIPDCDENCFDIWKRSVVCENCISIKAYKNNETMFKLEAISSKIYMVMAVPVTVQKKHLVLEMIKGSLDEKKTACISKDKLDNALKFLAEY